MAVIALHSAATGLSALSQDIDVIAHNIANSNTTGFKALRSNFEDLLYLEKQQPGVENANGDQRPATRSSTCRSARRFPTQASSA